DEQVHVLEHGPKGWRASKAGDLPGAGKGAIASVFGVLITCTDGSLARVRAVEGGGWRIDVVDRRDSPRSRVGSDGERVIVSDNDGTLSILEPGVGDAPWQRREVHREFALLRGAVLARFDPESDEVFAATAGYERKITLLREQGGRFWSRLLHADPDRLHHLAAGDFDGDGDQDLVACGYSRSEE